MNPRIKAVSTQDDYNILLTFTNGEKKIFDMKPYIDKGFFKQLQDKSYFRSVRTYMDSIKWQGGQDLCPDTLYLDSRDISG
jgi:hypothetical protein